MWNRERWPTRDGYMPFGLFYIYETELFAHQAHDRISATQSIRFGNGAARHENGDYTDEFREELELARILPRRSR